MEVECYRQLRHKRESMHLESLPTVLPAPGKQESQEANNINIESLTTVPAKQVKEESWEAYSSNSTSYTCQTRKP